MKLIGLVVLSGCALMAQKRIVTDEEVARVHKSAILIDTHNDVPMRLVDGFDIGKRAADKHTDLPRLREGGVGAVFFSIWVDPVYGKEHHLANRALQMIDSVRHDAVERYPESFQLALTAADIENAHKNGKIAALMGVEGGHVIENSIRLLRDYYALGARYMTLTWSNTHEWGDSSGDQDKPGVAHHNGLTEFGKGIVLEMNRLGMIVDISHVADKTFWDALATSKG